MTTCTVLILKILWAILCVFADYFLGIRMTFSFVGSKIHAV